VGTFPHQHGLTLFPDHLRKMGQTQDIAVVKGRSLANGLQESATREILQVVAEKQMVGRLTGKTLAGETRMEKAVATQTGQSVEIRSRRGLKRGSMIQGCERSVTKAIKQNKDDFH